MWAIVDPDGSSKDVSIAKPIEELKLPEPSVNIATHLTADHSTFNINDDNLKSQPPSPKFELTITSPKLLSVNPASPVPITPFSPIPVQISTLVLYLKPSFMDKMKNLNSTNWSSEIHFQGLYNEYIFFQYFF